MEVAAVTEWTPTVTFVISLWTLAALVAAFTVGMFNRFRKNMAADTKIIVQDELKSTTETLSKMQAQMQSFNEGLHAATELSLKHEGDLSGKDGLFSRVSHIEGVLSIKRIEPPGTVHEQI